MFLSIIHKNIKEFFTYKVWLLVIIFSIYIMYIIPDVKLVELSYFEFLLFALSDHYYIMYAMVITYAIFVFKLIRHDNEMILIRTKKYINYFKAQIISLLAISIIFVLIHVLIVMVIGYGLKVENIFSINQYTYNKFEVLEILSKYFNTPLEALLINLVYMITGLTFLGFIIYFLNHYFKTKIVIISIMFIYLLMLISIRTDIDNALPFVFVNNYLILHHAFAVLNKKYLLIIAWEFLCVTIALGLIKNFWSKQINLSNFIFFYKRQKMYINTLITKKNLIIIISLTILFVMSIILRYDNLTFNDLVILQFYGHGVGYFKMIDLLMLLIYNGIPIYMLCYFLEEESKGRSFFVTIRIRNKKTWLTNIVCTAYLFIFSYVVLTIVVSLLFGIVLGVKFSGYNYTKELFIINNGNVLNSWFVYFIILSSKSIELLLYFLIVFLFYTYSKNITISFVSLQLAYCVYFSKNSIVRYLPVGIGSLSRIKEFGGDGFSYFLVMCILLIFNFIIYFYLRMNRNKIFFN